MSDHQADAGELVDVLVPELDEVHDLLLQVEDVLHAISYATTADDAGDEWQLPVPFGGDGLYEAHQRVFAALEERLDCDLLAGRSDESARPRMIGADGKWEHAPLRLVPLARADLDLLTQAVTVMTTTLGSRDDLAVLLGALVSEGYLDLDVWPREPREPQGTRDLLRPFARLLAVLEMAPDPDTVLLVDVLRSHPDQDVVLTLDQELAYQRLADRFSLLLADRDPLTRYAF